MIVIYKLIISNNMMVDDITNEEFMFLRERYANTSINEGIEIIKKKRIKDDLEKRDMKFSNEICNLKSVKTCNSKECKSRYYEPRVHADKCDNWVNDNIGNSVPMFIFDILYYIWSSKTARDTELNQFKTNIIHDNSDINKIIETREKLKKDVYDNWDNIKIPLKVKTPCSPWGPNVTNFDLGSVKIKSPNLDLIDGQLENTINNIINEVRRDFEEIIIPKIRKSLYRDINSYRELSIKYNNELIEYNQKESEYKYKLDLHNDFMHKINTLNEHKKLFIIFRGKIWNIINITRSMKHTVSHESGGGMYGWETEHESTSKCVFNNTIDRLLMNYSHKGVDFVFGNTLVDAKLSSNNMGIMLLHVKHYQYWMSITLKSL